MNQQDAPLITDLAWGSIEVTIGSQKLRFRDCKIWPDGVREWNWRETGTEHSPGIQPADIEEILQHGVELMIFGCGLLSRLGICPETDDSLRKRGIEYQIENTKKAIILYNDLVRQGQKVGGLFHSTC